MHALDVDEKAALVGPGDFGLEGFAFFVALLQHAPSALASRPVDGQHDLSLVRLWLHDVDEDLLIYLHLAERISAKGVHLVGRDQALRLCAEIDEHAIALDGHDRAFDDFPSTERTEVGLRVQPALHGEVFVRGGHLRIGHSTAT